MSMVGLVMDVLLMALLVGALMFGLRLNARLKALRAGQEAFARAVAELDDAAIRAHQSLRELRGNADESQELLHSRIMAARDLIQKLDTASARAEKAARSLETGLANHAFLQSLSEEPMPARRAEGRAPFDRDVVREPVEPRRPSFVERASPAEEEADIPDRVLAGLAQMVRGGGTAPSQQPAPSPTSASSLLTPRRPSRRIHATDEDLF